MNPQTVTQETFGFPTLRAPFRLLSIRSPRQAELRTSSWLAPFRRHRTLRSAGVKDARCVRPISATQSNCVYPHLVCSRLALAAFAAGTPCGVLGSVGLTGGPNVSRRSKTASADRHRARGLMMVASRRSHEQWALSSHGAGAIEPLTPPVALCRSSPRLPHLREGCWLAVSSAFGLGARVGGCVRAPRPPVSAPRDRNAS